MKTSFQQRFLSLLGLGLLGLGLLAWALPGAAQTTYPNQPIKLVVPFSAGGPSDLLARLVANGIGERLQATMVVENKPGAGGNIGTAQVARADPDGYTLGIAYFGTLAINPSLYRTQSFDPVKDFAPIALLATNPLVLVTNAALPARSVSELIALAKSGKKQLNYASGGVGSANHLAAELFKTAVGIEMVHVPYKGIAPATTDLVGGQVDLMFNGLSSALPHIQSGKLRALAVTTDTRQPALADVPTMEEAGVKPFNVSAWFGLLAPRGTPPQILARLEKAALETMQTQDVKDKLAATGMVLSLQSQAEFTRFIKDQLDVWTPVVRASGAQLD